MHTYQVLIIGSGFAGQCAAINLLKAGIDDFRILERREFIGGTWCQNTYPGAAVDIPSPLYSLSFAPWPWSQMYADQAELQRYTEYLAEHFGLHAHIELATEVEHMNWDGQRQQWAVHTSKGSFIGQFVINASGPLSQPDIPTINGAELFQGRSFHSNQWDHSFDYRNKRVAVVGSGASAAQIIPAIAADVAQLHVFQRTPHWLLPRPDRSFNTFERWLMQRPWAYRLLRAVIYLQLESRAIGFKYSKAGLGLVQRMARKHIARQIKDPDLRRRLTPDFALGCKRVVLSSAMYPALTRPNVTLHSAGIEHMEQRGIVDANGQLTELDLIVWATGFNAIDGAIPYPIRGEKDQLLNHRWRPYPRAYLGTCVPDFPNLFILTGPNTGTGHTSALFMIEAQLHYVLGCIAAVREQGLSSIEVRDEAEGEYTRMIYREMEKTVWHWGGCRSWYQNPSGRVVAMFPGFSFSFYRLTRRVKLGDHVLR